MMRKRTRKDLTTAVSALKPLWGKMLMVCKDANTMSWRQQDENWEKDVRDEVGLDRDVGGWEDKKRDVHDPGEVDERGRKRKNEKRMGSRVRTWRGGK